VRTGHGTTTLIRAGKRAILIDPSLPDGVLAARLGERANVKAADITHVFLTSFNPELRRGIRLLDHATWWISREEREAVGVAMATELARLAAGRPGEEGDGNGEARAGAALRRTLEQDVALLKRCEPAPDSLATEQGERIDLFPLHGVTPGLSGVIVAGSRVTTLVCGDAVPTLEHLEQGKVLPNAGNVDRARESFAEAVEIADLMVLGRDNLVVNPTRRPF
jgi:glyoxylase-like metal-dependent hydrolase (beta-lactamase superfamily II)